MAGLVSLSNIRLGSVKTRFEGLCIMAVMVKDSSTELFQQHCLTWLRSIQQIIQSQDPLQTMELAVHVLHDLLQYSSQLPELARNIGLNSIPGILTSLLSVKPECHIAAMEGMHACMTFYPRACGSLRGKLGAYFLSKMDSENTRMQELACSCYSILPTLGSGFSQGIKTSEAWAQQLQCILATAHSLLGQLYEGAETDPVIYMGPGVELNFSPLDERDPLFILRLSQRYAGLCQSLSKLLSIDVTVPVKLPVQDIINLVCRALAVTRKKLNWLGDGPLKMLVLPTIHFRTLDVLIALIETGGSRLIRYSTVLCHLFAQTLNAWSFTNDTILPGQQRAYSTVRVQVYKTVQIWVSVAGSSSGVLQGSANSSEVLLGHILSDITPGTDTIKLRTEKAMPELSNNIGKVGGKRTKGLDVHEATSHMQGYRKQESNANSDCCKAALKSLNLIIINSGTLLKEETHKKLQELVVPLLVGFQQHGSLAANGTQTSPYFSPENRKELYHVLLALLLVPSPRWPPPLQCAVRAFSLGLGDINIMVASFCREALAICNVLIHPRTPSIAHSFSLTAAASTQQTMGKPGMAELLPHPQGPTAFRAGVTPPFIPPNPSSCPQPSGPLSLPSLLSSSNSFQARHPMNLPNSATATLPCSSLLGSLENHLATDSAAQLSTTSDNLVGTGLMDVLSPHHAGLEESFSGAADGHKPVFVRYDKEEAEDVEISLESDSDDSVVIVPEGLLIKQPAPQSIAAQNQEGRLLEQDNVEGVGSAGGTSPKGQANNITGAVPGIGMPSATDTVLSTTSASSSVVASALANSFTSSITPLQTVPPTAVVEPQQAQYSSQQMLQQQSEEDSAVININSSDDDEEEEEEEEEEDDEEYPEEEGFYEDDEEEEDYEEYEDEECLEDLEEESEEEEEDGEMIDDDEEDLEDEEDLDHSEVMRTGHGTSFKLEHVEEEMTGLKARPCGRQEMQEDLYSDPVDLEEEGPVEIDEGDHSLVEIRDGEQEEVMSSEPAIHTVQSDEQEPMKSSVDDLVEKPLITLPVVSQEEESVLSQEDTSEQEKEEGKSEIMQEVTFIKNVPDKSASPVRESQVQIVLETEVQEKVSSTSTANSEPEHEQDQSVIKDQPEQDFADSSLSEKHIKEDVESKTDAEENVLIQDETGKGSKKDTETKQEEVSIKQAEVDIELRELEAKDPEEEEQPVDERGLKRKREEEPTADENPDKKKLTEEDSTAAMLADFVDCPPDEEEATPSFSKDDS
ncbi:proline-, glutamic acid- and leucine-rich protein 1-like [Polypterus senegalus]